MTTDATSRVNSVIRFREHFALGTLHHLWVTRQSSVPAFTAVATETQRTMRPAGTRSEWTLSGSLETLHYAFTLPQGSLTPRCNGRRGTLFVRVRVVTVLAAL